MSTEVTVRSVPGAAWMTEIEAGNHAWLADEPAAANGDDLGPNPYDLLLAALGSCTTMTLNVYARRKGWPLEGVTVRLRHERHAAPSDDGRSTIRWEEIRREIDLVGPLDEEQRARLREIAGRCPVHRTIVGDLRVIDEVVAGAGAEAPAPAPALVSAAVESGTDWRTVGRGPTFERHDGMPKPSSSYGRGRG